MEIPRRLGCPPRKKPYIFFAFIAMLTLAVYACNSEPKKVDLTFESIEQIDWAGPKSYKAIDPGLKVISRIEELESLDGLITEKARKALLGLDYNDNFALIVFQGWKPSTGYSIQVDRITRVGDDVNIYLRFNEPEPDTFHSLNFMVVLENRQPVGYRYLARNPTCSRFSVGDLKAA